MKKAICSLLILLVGLMITSYALAAQGADTITFTDSVLEAKVREALGKPEGDITLEDAASLQSFFANVERDSPEDTHIKSVEDLRYFTNLESLGLSGNSIRDISPLIELTSLTRLYIGEQNIADLSPLGHLTNLVQLGFDGQFRELPFLSNLTELTEVNIGACRTLPLELMSLKNLTIFSCPGGELEDISMLAQIPTLTAVDISWNLVSDLTPLKDLPLTELYIAENPITDYTPIQHLVPNLGGLDVNRSIILASTIPEDPLVISDANLEQALRVALNIYDRPITLRDAYQAEKLEIETKDGAAPYTDITALDAFVNVYAVNITNNKVSDLTPLQSLTSLSWLSIRSNSVSDLTPLASITALESLYMEDNPIADVTPLTSLPKLHTVFLNRLPTCDYAPLDAIVPSLRETNLINVLGIQDSSLVIADANLEALLRKVTGVQDRLLTTRDAARVIEIQTGVEELWQQVADIAPLSAFVNLERLVIFGSQISDLTPLAALPKLMVLIINNSQISEISPLANIQSLGYLELTGNQITDVSVLASLPNLSGLDVSYNQIADLSPLLSLKNLNVLRISHNIDTDASPFADVVGQLKDMDFDPSKPMPAYQQEQPSGGLREPEKPDKVIKFADAVLERRIREAIGKPEGKITAGEAAQVTELYLNNEWQESYPKGTQISKLSGIEYFINLKTLDISCNKIKDISKLAGLTSLEHLRAFSNVIRDVKPLAKLVNLRNLNLGSNQISSIKPLSSLTNLTELLLSENSIKDHTPIADIYPRLQNTDFKLE